MFALDVVLCLFFFNDTATTEIYTLSLHDALPIWRGPGRPSCPGCSSGPLRRVHRVLAGGCLRGRAASGGWAGGRKSTRLNSSHTVISYAVFCLKKKMADSKRLTGANGNLPKRCLP